MPRFTHFIANLVVSMALLLAGCKPGDLPQLSISSPSSSAMTKASVLPRPTLTATAPVSEPRCASTTGVFVPARLVIPRLGINYRVLAEDLKRGSLPTPELHTKGIDPRHTVSWFVQSAKPGSGKGTVYLGGHTYPFVTNPKTDAFGNKLRNGARVGVIGYLTDTSGKARACFRLIAQQPSPGSAIIKGMIVERSATALVPPEFYAAGSGPARVSLHFCWDRLGEVARWSLRDTIVGEFY